MTTNLSHEADLPPDIVALEDVAPHPNLLIFGYPGSGKTCLAGSDDNVLIVSTETEGTLSAKRMGSNASQWVIRKGADLDKLYNWALTLAEQEKPIPFKWFAIDSITKLQEILMREQLVNARKLKPNKDIDVPEWPDYLKNQKRLLRIVTEFNALPVNMLWTALVRENTDPEGNSFLFPAIQGKGYEIAQMVLAEMTSYGYLFVHERKDQQGKKIQDRIIVWEDTGSMSGKDRTCSLAPYTKNLSLKQIRERIEREELNETASVIELP